MRLHAMEVGWCPFAMAAFPVAAVLLGACPMGGCAQRGGFAWDS